MAWGFLGRNTPSESERTKTEYLKRLRKEGGYGESASDTLVSTQGESQVRSQEASKVRLNLLKKNAANKERAAYKKWHTPTKEKLGNVIRKIGWSQQRFAKQPVERRERYVREDPNNFFEHKDELEVYGDEGLTFFDSNKRSRGRTGSFFGI